MSEIALPDWVTTYGLARLAVFAIASLVIAALFRRERLQVGQAIILYAIAIAARVAAFACAALELETFARMNDFVALLLQGMAFLNLALASVFGTLSAAVRFEPPGSFATSRRPASTSPSRSTFSGPETSTCRASSPRRPWSRRSSGSRCRTFSAT